MENRISPSLTEILDAMNRLEYLVFDNASGHDLNLVGVRSSLNEPNRFNDWLTVFYIFSDTWIYFAFPATTDPGLFYRLNPINVLGTAILKPGQYRAAYKIGRHRGYEALQQKGSLIVWRDNDRDEELDIGAEDEGIHAINIHRANAHDPSIEVGKWSAGCQVIQDPDHFEFLLQLCRRAREKYGNSFTYTLLEEQDLYKGG